jgi:hypothetical protein
MMNSLRFAAVSLRRRPGAAASALVGLVGAGLGFSLLLAVASQTKIVLGGDLQRTWDTPYDILVRSSGSRAVLEDQDGLVRPNFLTGLTGGITTDQLHAIRSLSGVTTAAPIAPTGFVEWPAAIDDKLQAPDKADEIQVLRITTTISGDAGLSRYPADRRFLISAASGKLDIGSRIMTTDRGSLPCSGSTNCFAGSVCRPDGCSPGDFPSVADTRYYLPFLQPIAIAGIDPAAEASLVHLDRCVTSGRMLDDSDRVSERQEDVESFASIPILLSDRSFIDQEIRVSIDQAGTGVDPTHLDAAEGWHHVRTVEHSFGDLYRAFIPSLHDYQDPWPIWSSGDVTYRVIGDRHLAADTIAGGDTFAVPPTSTEFDVDPRLVIPPEEGDVAFRTVTIHPYAPASGAQPGPRWKLWNVIGTYDPTCLAGFDPLGGGPLETYAYPAVRLPDGRLLPPNRAMAGYVNTPPLALTTLEGAAWLADPTHYQGQPGAAFIGAIRIAARTDPTPSQEAYRQLVALSQEIQGVTGLHADVLKGGSPEPIGVDLPAGRFGRPALTATEGWSKMGVAANISEGIAAQDAVFGGIALVALIGMVGLIFWVSAERRREEVALLRWLGWPAGDVDAMLSREYAILAVVAGAIIGPISLLLGSGAGISNPLFTLLSTATPFAIGVGTGRMASRLPWRSVAEGMDEGGAAVRRSSHRPTITRIAFAELWYGQPRLSLLVCAGLALGLLLLGASIFVAVAFGGRLEVTALDERIRFQVAPFHWWLASIVLITAVLAVSQAAELAFERRRSRLTLLRAIGWSRTDLVRLQVVQAAIIGGASAVAPAVAVLVASAVLGDLAHGVLVGAGIFIVALAAAGLASLRTAVGAFRLSVVRGLAEA